MVNLPFAQFSNRKTNKGDLFIADLHALCVCSEVRICTVGTAHALGVCPALYICTVGTPYGKCHPPFGFFVHSQNSGSDTFNEFTLGHIKLTSVQLRRHNFTYYLWCRGLNDSTAIKRKTTVSAMFWIIILHILKKKMFLILLLSCGKEKPDEYG